MIFLGAQWLHSPPARIPSPAETKAIQAALAQYSTKYGRNPSASRTIRVFKLEGMGWIVQITERVKPEAVASRMTNTFHVADGSSCQWLSIDEWGAY
jgi:hypothetical protein